MMARAQEFSSSWSGVMAFASSYSCYADARTLFPLFTDEQLYELAKAMTPDQLELNSWARAIIGSVKGGLAGGDQDPRVVAAELEFAAAVGFENRKAAEERRSDAEKLQIALLPLPKILDTSEVDGYLRNVQQHQLENLFHLHSCSRFARARWPKSCF